MRALRTREIVDLASVLGDSVHRLAFGAGHDGAVVAVGATTSGPDLPTESRLVWWREGASGAVRLHRVPISVDGVQPHPEGTLLVASQSPGHAGEGRQNAIVVDRDGHERARFALGDGVVDVRTSPDGTMWVTYSDQVALGRGRLGSGGLRRFTPSGDPGPGYDASRANTGPIVECYAMNVVGDDDAYLYFSTSFPIVRIHRGAYRVWQCDWRSARAMAVRRDRALLFGPPNARSAACIVELGRAHTAPRLGELVVTGPDGEPVDDARALGVGERLYLLAGTRVLVLDGWWEG